MAIVLDLSPTLTASLAADGSDEMARCALQFASRIETIIHDIDPDIEVQRRSAADFPASEKSSILIVGSLIIGAGLGGLAFRDPEGAKKILEKILKTVHEAITRPKIKISFKNGQQEGTAEVTSMDDLAPAVAAIQSCLERRDLEADVEGDEPHVQIEVCSQGFKALPPGDRKAGE